MSQLLETDEREDDVAVIVEWKGRAAVMGRRNEQLRHGRAKRYPCMSKT
jgi:hypothetical protein